jgi:hypothetical protein
MTNQQIDPTEKAFGRMHALLRESTEREAEILKTIADLKQRALSLRAAADPSDHNHVRYNKAQADATQMEREAQRLAIMDLRGLRQEREAIRQFRTLELSRMMLAANQAAEKAKADHTQQLLDAITEAKGALYEHLRKLATVETLPLFQAVYDAEAAANVEHTEAGEVLLGITHERETALKACTTVCN